MTKPSPLKGKTHTTYIKGIKHHIDEDIESAVEWYFKYRTEIKKYIQDYPADKYVLKKLRILPHNGLGFNYADFNDWLLRKAFEDVMKK